MISQKIKMELIGLLLRNSMRQIFPLTSYCEKSNMYKIWKNNEKNILHQDGITPVFKYF